MPERVHGKYEVNPIKRGLIIALTISLLIGIAIVLLVFVVIDSFTR